MDPRGVSRRIILLIVLALGLSLGTAGLFKHALEAALPGSELLQRLVRLEWQAAQDTNAGDAEAPDYTYDLGRASRRYLLLVAILLFSFGRLPWSKAHRRGFRHEPQRAAKLRYGLLLSLGLVAAYAVLQFVFGNVVWADPAAGYLARKIMEFAGAAALIAFVEELFFRGLVFRFMLRDWGVWPALFASSALFAVLHCISGSFRVAPGWSPGIGLRLFAVYYTDGQGSVIPDLRLIVGLFLLGWLLAYLYLRTGSLWAPVGLHAGIVFFSKLMKKLLERGEDFPEWLLGDPLFIVSGVLCWVLLAIALVVVTQTAPRGRLYRRLQRVRRPTQAEGLSARISGTPHESGEQTEGVLMRE